MRTDDRQKHVPLRLRLLVDERWEQVQAQDWNQVGFNFYCAHALPGPVLSFKRGLVRFDGTTAWASTHADVQVVRAMLVNEMLYQQARKAAQNAQVHERLVRLIRAEGMLEEKRKALTSLGVHWSDAQLDALVAQRQREHPLHRYGVKVESDAWSRVVDEARQLTAVVDALDRWSGNVGKPNT
ncbi:hypothetical protein RQP54_15565 [Curvibacter sp. APW13]|uniref:hypothetical protein n=1 Tax=Curvibacter sp. APW13 TaxID=3077236 RepID=UPI0028DF602A|nr:hypothetical protein [Curvibacter sp. APW13]MDT8992290.1 hypothetical protein [Curvibacter sp. APW13]